MVAYHFLPMKYALQCLTDRKLKVATYEDMNDPFELMCCDLTDRNFRKQFERLKKEIDQRFGAICFAKNWNNPVLWSHYAEKHKGICLGFEIVDDSVDKIDYINERIQVDVSEMIEGSDYERVLIDKVRRSKFVHWKYEDEVRYNIRLDPDSIIDGFHFLGFADALKLTKVIIGCRCKKTVDEIKLITKNYGSHVEIIKARMAFKSFNIVENLQAKRD